MNENEEIKKNDPAIQFLHLATAAGVGAGLSSLFPGIDPVALGFAAGALSDKIEPFATKTGGKLNEVVDNVSGRIGDTINNATDRLDQFSEKAGGTISHLFQKNGNQTQTPSEKEAEVQNLADDEKRKQLEVNLNVLQQKFDERHPDHDSPHTQELQKKLDEQFDAVRAQLEAKLAADRQIPLEQDKDRSR